eukprot:1160449-Pelagomonas_calceolata.AAC.9
MQASRHAISSSSSPACSTHAILIIIIVNFFVCRLAGAPSAPSGPEPSSSKGPRGASEMRLKRKQKHDKVLRPDLGATVLPVGVVFLTMAALVPYDGGKTVLWWMHMVRMLLNAPCQRLPLDGRGQHFAGCTWSALGMGSSLLSVALLCMQACTDGRSYYACVPRI